MQYLRALTVFIFFCTGLLWLPSVIVLAQVAPRASGDATRLVGDADDAFGHPQWSPDGRYLAVSRPGYNELWVLHPDGSGLRQITDEAAAGFGYTWAPDGSALLARVARYDGPRRFNAVKVFDVETGAVQQLTEYRTMMPALPMWSADGTQVLLLSRGTLETLATDRAAFDPSKTAQPTLLVKNSHIESVDASTGIRTVINASGEQSVLNLVASPDGAQVAFERMGGGLHVMNADGTGLVDLGMGNRPRWSPDSQWVVFMRAEDDGHAYTASDIYAARNDGSEMVQLTRTPDRLEMNPSWSPDGRFIAFDDIDEGAVYVLPLAE